MNELERLMRDIAIRCKLLVMPEDWEFELYRLIERGFHSFFKYKREGMVTEDMTGLKRASVRVGGWVRLGKLYSIEQWTPLYDVWRIDN